MATFPDIKPSATSTLERKQRVTIANYGDGYVQAASYGKDPFYDEWNLIFNPIEIDEFNQLMTFWTTVGQAVKFDWKSPIDTVTKQWMFIESLKAGTNGCIYSVSGKIREVK
jgi:phage-related protein